MSIIIFLLLLILIFLFGLSITILLKVKDYIEVWSLSWLIGMGLSSLIWFIVYQYFTIPFDLKSILIVLLLSNLVTFSYIFSFKKKTSLFIFSSTRIKEYISKTFHIYKKDKIKVVVASSILLICIFILFQNIFWPVTDWDSLALYDFRAKVIVNTGTLNDGLKLGYFFQYPLFTSLLHTITYLSGIQSAKIWYALIFQSEILLFYVLLKRKSNKLLSLIGSLFLASIPLIFAHAFMAYTNLSYTVFTSSGFIYLWLWLESKNRKDLFFCSLLIGLGTWVRISEPFYYVGAMIVLYGFIQEAFKIKHISRTRLIEVVLACSCMIYTRYPWDNLILTLFSANVNKPISSISLVKDWNISTIVNKIVPITKYLFTYSFPVYSTYFYISIFLLISDLQKKKWLILHKYVTIFLIILIIFVGTMITSLWLESWNRIGDSVARMSMFLIPLLIYTVFTSPSLNQYRKEK